jgi:3-oxoacyl-(acyl-carrier-protein) synthase
LNRIVVTGVGIITAIGDSAEANRQSLMQGKCGIDTISLFSSKYAGVLPAGEIKIETKSIAEKLNAHERGATRTDLLALHAFREAIADAGLGAPELSSADTALIGATTVGGMCLTDELYHDANATNAGSAYLSSYDCGASSLYLQQKHKIGGVVNTINTACSSSANAIMYGARLIKNGFAKRVIAGGTDSLAKFTINGFNSLHILSNQNCRPFDNKRDGLNLGEGAAFIVLEREDDCRHKKIYAELTGYGNSNDAFHPSSISDNGEGPFLSMQRALTQAAVLPADVNFINAHGTATENNDETESRAMLRLFNQPPSFASTKGNTGHTLGAAGAVEAVYSILNLNYQEIYPAIHFSAPIESTGLTPVQQYRQISLKHIMSNSFGFGGNCTSLIFSKS